MSFNIIHHLKNILTMAESSGYTFTYLCIFVLFRYWLNMEVLPFIKILKSQSMIHYQNWGPSTYPITSIFISHQLFDPLSRFSQMWHKMMGLRKPNKYMKWFVNNPLCYLPLFSKFFFITSNTGAHTTILSKFGILSK